MWLDECGRAFFVDPAQAGHAGDGVAGAAATTAIPSGTDVFALESVPGSARTIYLDFLGDTVSDTGWNDSVGAETIVAKPMSLDDRVDTEFSAEELEAIYQAWLVVSEDFAPFDVNVTTKDPGFASIDRSSMSDDRYGTRVLITTGGAVEDYCGRCGGIAYLDTIGLPSGQGIEHAYYQPAWVFSDRMWSGWNIGQAASHEVGHNFGLVHDGMGGTEYFAGDILWAPIMGASYDRPLSQWSQGEYPGATSQQDDVAVITHNAAVRRDDHGNTPDTATALDAHQPREGVISTRDDIDAFSFTASGNTSITVRNPDRLDTNLDVQLTILDTRGQPVDTVAPSPSLVNWTPAHPVDPAFEATWVATLPGTPQHYTALVDGVGIGNGRDSGYSDYGSLGRYRIQLTDDDSPDGPLEIAGPTELTIGAERGFSLSVLSATGGVPPYRWSGDLPDGIRIDPETGTLSGVVAATSAARELQGSVQLTDAHGHTAVHAVTFAVESILIPSMTFQVGQGEPFTFHLDAVGRGPITWVLVPLVGGEPPAGVSLDADGMLHGVVDDPGSFPLQVVASNAYTDALGVATLVVEAESLVINEDVVRFVENTPGQAQLTVAGATPGVPVEWRAFDDMPKAFTLDRDGTLYGTPRTAGDYEVIVEARSRYSSTEKLIHVVVAPDEHLVVRSATLRFAQDRSGSAYLDVDGARGEVTWASQTALPDGLVLEPDGRIHGTPRAPGTTTVDVRATTPWSSVTGTVRIVVDPRPLVISTRSLPAAHLGRRYLATVRLADPAGAITWQLQGRLPAGLAFRPATNTWSAAISGTPKRRGAYRFSVLATDAETGVQSKRTYSLTVLAS